MDGPAVTLEVSTSCGDRCRPVGSPPSEEAVGMAGPERVRAQIVDLLRSREVQRIDFHVGGLAIGPPEFRRLADAVADGRVKVEVAGPGQLPAGWEGIYFATPNPSMSADADTIRVARSLRFDRPSGRALLLHECVHAVVDMNRAVDTRLITEEAAGTLAESLYLYQVLGQRTYEKVTLQRDASYVECRNLVYQYFVEPPTPAHPISPATDPPLKNRSVWLPPALYQPVLDALKQGRYAHVDWSDAGDVDGVAESAVPQGGCGMVRFATGTPIPATPTETMLGDVSASLRRDFGSAGEGAGETLSRTVQDVWQRVRDGVRDFVLGPPQEEAPGPDAALGRLAESLRDRAVRPVRATRPDLPGTTDDADALLEHARDLARDAARRQPAAATGAAGHGVARIGTDEDWARVADVAARAAARAAQQIVGAPTWSGIQEAALSVTDRVARDAALQALRRAGTRLTPAHTAVAGGLIAAGPGAAGIAAAASQAALAAARQTALTHDWALHQAAAGQRIQQAATDQARRTLGSLQGSTWNRLGAALDRAPGAVGTGPVGAARQPYRDHSAAGMSTRIMSTLVAETAASAAAAAAVPMVSGVLQAGLGAMHTAAYDAARGAFAPYDAGFRSGGRDVSHPSSSTFHPETAFGGIGAGLGPHTR